MKMLTLVLSVCLAASLFGNFYFTQLQIPALDMRFTDSQQQQITTLQAENEALQNEVNQARAPHIYTALGARDIRTSPARNHPWSHNIRLYIEGNVWNLGTETAKNCTLEVTLFQNGFVANHTFISIGDLSGGSWAYVETNIPYSGSALTNWTIIPVYDNP